MTEQICGYCGRKMNEPIVCGPNEEGVCQCCGLIIIAQQAPPYASTEDTDDE